MYAITIATNTICVFQLPNTQPPTTTTTFITILCDTAKIKHIKGFDFHFLVELLHSQHSQHQKCQKKLKTKVADDIPEEITDQILDKLPIKSLMRFTCVSKSWLSLIKKNPSFISTHLNISITSSRKNPLFLLRYYSNHLDHYSLYFDNEEYDHYMDLPSPFKTNNSCFRVVGTVNGLIYLVNDIGHDISLASDIIVWNPSIKKFITLSKPNSGFYGFVSLGLGFDSSSNDYKVLRLAEPFSYDDEDEDTFAVEVYSLNTNTWKRICKPVYWFRFDGQAFVNGVMHMLSFRMHLNFILGFDIGDGVFKEIALPQSLADKGPFVLNVAVYKESIAVFEKAWVGPGGVFHVWVMEEYGVLKSWTKIFSIDGQELVLPRMLGFMKIGELFLRMRDGEMVLYDRESKENKSLKISGFYPFVHYFVENMELLDNANAQNEPTVENDATGNATAAND